MNKFSLTSMSLLIILLSGCATSNGLESNNYNHSKSTQKEKNQAIITNVSNSYTATPERYNPRTFINIRNSQNNFNNQKNNFLNYEKHVWDSFTQKDKHLFFKLLHTEYKVKKIISNGSSWMYKNGKYVKIESTATSTNNKIGWSTLITRTLKQSRFCNDRNFSPYIINYFEKLNVFASDCSENKNCLTDKNIRELQKSKEDVTQYFIEKLKKD